MYERTIDPTAYIFGAIVFYLISLLINHAIIRGMARQANLRTEMLLWLNASILAEMALQKGVNKEFLDTAFGSYNARMSVLENEKFKYPLKPKIWNKKL